MSSNPWVAGNFFSNPFAGTPEFTFRNPLTDQRQSILMEIEAIKQTSLIAFSVNGTLFNYYYVDTGGTLQSLTDLDDFLNTENTRFSYVGGSMPPSYYVMTDENNDLKYIETSFGETPTLGAFSAPSGAYPVSAAHFIGPYFDLLAENGTDFYRLTVNSGLTISVDFHRSEPERAQSICLGNGHQFAFRNGRTFHQSLIQLGDVTTEVPNTEIGFSGVTNPRIGISRVSLHDQSFDYLTNQDWEGRDVTIFIGPTDLDPILYPIAIRAKTKNMTFNEDTISIAIEDSGQLWDRSINESFYQGTGGYEGDEEIKGKPKPLCFGRARNISPVRVSESLNLYQIHDGAIHADGIVMQGGVFLPNLGDFPDTLLDWVPTQSEIQSGNYRTDLARGMFRLAAPPGAPITCFQAEGDAQLPLFPSVMDTIRLIINRRMPEAIIDEDSFNAIEVPFGAFFIGVYITEDQTLRQFFTEILNSFGGAISIDLLNQVRISLLQQAEPAAYITENSYINFRREPPPNKPADVYRFGFEKSWTVFTESDFLLNADPSIRAFATSEFRFQVNGPFASAIANRFPTAKTKTINTFFQSSAQMPQIVEYVITREQAFRDVFTITVFGFDWQLKIGDTVLVEIPRWGLDVPRACVIVGITERSPTAETENITTLRLWG